MRKLFFFLSFFFLLATRCYSVDLHIAWENQEQPPYYIGTGETIPEKPGVAVEMVLMLGEYIEGLNVIPHRYPWTRCKRRLQKGLVDGIFNASYKKKRLTLGWYPTIDNSHQGLPDISKKITTISYSLYKQKNARLDWDGSSFIHLQGQLAAPLGYSIVDDLATMGVNVQESISTKQALEQLSLGRVAGVAAQDITADALLAAMPKKLANLVKVKPPIKTKAYFLMLSHQFVNNHPQLAQKIWQTIEIIRKTRLEEIAAKYIE